MKQPGYNAGFKAGLQAQAEKLARVEKALKDINDIIYAAGAPLGSENYFKIRGLATDS